MTKEEIKNKALEATEWAAPLMLEGDAVMPNPPEEGDKHRLCWFKEAPYLWSPDALEWIQLSATPPEHYLDRATEFSFGHPDTKYVTVKKTNFEDNLWAVRYGGSGGLCLHKDGNWSYEPLPSSRDEEFYKNHRFTLQEAMIKAKLKYEEMTKEIK